MTTLRSLIEMIDGDIHVNLPDAYYVFHKDDGTYSKQFHLPCVSSEMELSDFMHHVRLKRLETPDADPLVFLINYRGTQLDRLTLDERTRQELIEMKYNPDKILVACNKPVGSVDWGVIRTVRISIPKDPNAGRVVPAF